jgi:hypothetical protein
MGLGGNWSDLALGPTNGHDKIALPTPRGCDGHHKMSPWNFGRSHGSSRVALQPRLPYSSRCSPSQRSRGTGGSNTLVTCPQLGHSYAIRPGSLSFGDIVATSNSAARHREHGGASARLVLRWSDTTCPFFCSYSRLLEANASAVALLLRRCGNTMLPHATPNMPGGGGFGYADQADATGDGVRSARRTGSL